MNKIIIPAILATTVLVAGIFAFMPVQKAQTIHSSIASSVTGLVQTGSITAGTNLDDAVVNVLTADRTGMACVQVMVTDTTDGAPTNDPGVAVIIDGVTVATINPGDNLSVSTTQCAQISATGTIQVDQQGADTDAGNTVNRAIASVVADTG